MPSPPPLCRRCGGPIPAGSPVRNFCSRQHQLEARRQHAAFIAAGAGCGKCYRGGVFFRWREDGGRERVPITALEETRVAPCWCPAGLRLELETGYKRWGYMRDFGPDGEREIAPRLPPLERCRQE